MIRQSIEPTYDSRETGPRYWVTSTVNDKPASWMEPTADPFVRHTVSVSWRDIFRALLRGQRVTVAVSVGGDRSIVDDVLELDADTLISNSTRRQEFNGAIQAAMTTHPQHPGEWADRCRIHASEGA